MPVPHERLGCFGSANASIPGFAIGMINGELDTFEIIVVAVDAGRRSKLAFLLILCWVTLATACCSLLMLLVTRKGARLCFASRTAIFRLLGVAGIVSMCQ